MKLQAVLLSALFLLGCNSRIPEKGTTPLERYNWRESFRYRATTEQAVAFANLILESRTTLRFRVGWKAGEDRDVPVYLVDGDRLPPQHIVFVPDGERCVIVNTDSLPTLLGYFAPQSYLAWPVQSSEVLAFALLHEAGHLESGDHGSFVEETRITKSDILAVSLSRDSVKSREIVSRNAELRADLFAVDAIEAAQNSSKDDVHDAGVRMALLMSNLEWNLGVSRDPVSAGFGGKRKQFFDSSYTHPNLEFRLRVVDAVIAASKGERLVDYALNLFLGERSQSSPNSKTTPSSIDR